MARRMHASRAALGRLLDPGYEALTLGTVGKAAAAVGRQLRLELVEAALTPAIPRARTASRMGASQPYPA